MEEEKANSHLLHSKDESHSKVGIDETSYLTEPDQSIWQIFCSIITNGTLGAFVFLLLVGVLASGAILCGRLPDSKIYVAAFGVGCAYLGVITSTALGLNAGFNVLVGRCYGMKDYKT